MRIFLVIALCFAYAVLNVSGAAIIKFQIPNYSLNSVLGYVKFLFTWQVILGFGVILASALVMFKALSLGKFSYIIPLSTGINFSMTVLLGVFLFNDRLSVFSYIGLLLILVGIVFMNLKVA